MPVRLIKYCSSKYNPTKSATHIQLGTLEYYRTLDPKFAIADSLEGVHKIEFRKGVEIKVNPNIGQHLFDGAISGEGLTMDGGCFEATICNSYIFCVSQVGDGDEEPTPEIGRRYDATYDSVWEITNPRGFGQIVGAALSRHLSVANLSPESLDDLQRLPPDKRSIQILAHDAPVTYVDSRIERIDSAGDVVNVTEYGQALERTLFRKEMRDQHQREHRFVFLLVNETLGALSVAVDPVRIPLNFLHPYISSPT